MSSRAGGTQCWQAPEQIRLPPDACRSDPPLLLSMSSPAPSAATLACNAASQSTADPTLIHHIPREDPTFPVWAFFPRLRR